MVSREPRSGYEIKAAVDNSTRFFWAASYGQIYPELKRLSEAGLVEGVDASARRAQADRLRDHRRRRGGAEGLAAPAAADLRDARRRAAEALLRRRPAAARRRWRSCARCASTGSSVAERLRGMEPMTARRSDPFPLMVLQGGIEFNEWFADWCERMEARLLDSARRRKEQLMFDSLARLADGKARRDRPPRDRLLPPRRRDRRLASPAASTPTAPTTRRPRRSKRGNGCRTPACGSRRCSAIVKDAPVAAPATRARVEALERSVRRRPDVALGHRLLRHPLPRLRLPRRPLDLLRRHAEDRPTTRSGRKPAPTSPTSSPAKPGRRRRRRRGRPGAGQQAGREGPADGRDARLPAALPALASSSSAASSPRCCR